MDFITALVLLVSTLIGQYACQDLSLTSTVTPTTYRHGISDVSSKGTTSVSVVMEGSLVNVTVSSDGSLVTAPSVWVKCTADVKLDDLGNDNIAKVLKAWCENYENISECLSRDITTSSPDSPLDFFINLTFNKDTLRSRSEFVCTQFREKKDKLSCADTTNQTLAGSCAAEFSGGMMHVLALHKEKQLPKDVLREIACDVTLQTTFCLRDTLSRCEEDVQTVLLGYYSLFTNDSCIAKERPPKQETIVSKCAREAAQTLSREQAEPEPTSLLDFLILGLKTDCETYVARYSCYKRELVNITNFRDFWLSLTFDHDNAVASQTAYCDQINKYVIPQITSECFNRSQPNLAACEGGFGREVEAIREEWFKTPEFDGLQLQTLACRTSVTRAACLDNAMQPCGVEVSRAMAASEVGILPDICRRLLSVTIPGKTGLNSALDFGNITKIDETNRTFSENQTTPNRNNAPGYVQKEWSVPHEAAPGNNHEQAADKPMNQSPTDKILTQNEVTTSKAMNETDPGKRSDGRQTRRHRFTSTSSKSSSHGQDNGAGDNIMITVLEIVLGVLVSSLSCLQI